MASVVVAVVVLLGFGVAPSFALSSEEGISGTVTEEGGGPLAQICVGVFYWDYYYDEEWGEYWYLAWAGSAETDAAGQYTVLVPPRTDYLVRFYDGCDAAEDHIAEWYDSQPTEYTATPVSVSSGTVTPNIDAALVLAGAISGTVTAEEDAQPLAGICVWLYDGTSPIRSTVTDTSGHYSFFLVPPGSYSIRFVDCDYGPADRAGEWYDDQATVDAADPVTVVAGNTTAAIDAVLALATYTLSVTSSGDGSGTVTSSPVGIECGTDCSEDYTYGSVVTLTATPAGSTFEWGGDCSGIGQCSVTMNGPRTVHVFFRRIPPQIAIADTTVNEGDAGTVAATFVVTRARNATESFSVRFATRDGTAHSITPSGNDFAPPDYQSVSGRITFVPTETAKTIEVTVNGDTVPEPYQDFTVVLTDPVGGAMDSVGVAMDSDMESVGTIVDDDPFCPGLEGFPGRQIVGTPGVDRLTGTSHGEWICGLGGNDIIRGGEGDDFVFGGAGHDVLRGQGGRDELKGGGGKDELSGGPSADSCIGGPGTDTAAKCEDVESIP